MDRSDCGVVATGRHGSLRNRSFTLTAAGATVTTGADGEIASTWPLDVPARGEAAAAWSLALHDDPSLVVRGGTTRPHLARGATSPPSRRRRPPPRPLARRRARRPRRAAAHPPRPPGRRVLRRRRAVVLHAVRPRLRCGRPGSRSRSTPAIAASTLRVLARLQGTGHDVATAQQPGKILHELRATPLEIPGEGVVLPPAVLRHASTPPRCGCASSPTRGDAGMPRRRGRRPAARPARRPDVAARARRQRRRRVHRLHRRDRARAGEPGLEGLRRLDPVARRDASPRDRSRSARCRATPTRRRSRARTCSSTFGEAGGDALRGLGRGLRGAVRRVVLGRDARGPLPGGRAGRGTSARSTRSRATSGTCSAPASSTPTEEAARRRRSCSGPRCRPGSASARCPPARRGTGRCQLPRRQRLDARHRHRGARHARAGLARAGAAGSCDGLLAAAEGFAFRVPELHSGDSGRREPRIPTPYPAACRPQAWSAAAAVTCLAVSWVDLDARTNRLPTT